MFPTNSLIGQEIAWKFTCTSELTPQPLLVECTDLWEMIPEHYLSHYRKASPIAEYTHAVFMVTWLFISPLPVFTQLFNIR